MKVKLSDSTLDSLEAVTGKKITRNGDQVIQELCDKASGGCRPKQGAWMEPDTNEMEKQNDSS